MRGLRHDGRDGDVSRAGLRPWTPSEIRRVVELGWDRGVPVEVLMCHSDFRGVRKAFGRDVIDMGSRWPHFYGLTVVSSGAVPDGVIAVHGCGGDVLSHVRRIGDTVFEAHTGHYDPCTSCAVFEVIGL